MPKVEKRYLKNWNILGYDYQIHEVVAGKDSWLEANPVTKGITRTAENETVLRILLTNDAKNISKFYKRVR